MEPRKVALGWLLLFVSSLTLLATGAVAVRLPLYLAALTSLTLSVGSLVTDARRREGPAHDRR